jgi:hypothetical protein
MDGAIYFDPSKGFIDNGGNSLVSGNSDGSPPSIGHDYPFSPDQMPGGILPSSGYSSSSYSAPAYDQGELDSFHTQKGNIRNSAGDWAKNYGIGLGGSIHDFINGLQSGQRSLDERGVQNELGYTQGRQGVLGMVSRGIKSGGVMLANRNASDSSASAALANAYGQIGQGQLNSLGNQRAIEDRNIGLAQDQFNVQAQAGARKIQDAETMDINQTVSDARDKLTALDQWGADRSLPERIQVEQEKARIKSQIEDALSQQNQDLQGYKNVKPTSANERRATAAELANAGQAAVNPFEFSDQTPVQFQNQPFSGNLPLFTLPTKKKQ